MKTTIITLQMEDGSGDSHLVLADAMVLAVVLRANLGDVQSHGGFVSAITRKVIRLGITSCELLLFNCG
jgi:hypothetical protein